LLERRYFYPCQWFANSFEQQHERSSPLHAEFDFDVLSALTMSPLWPFAIEEQHLVRSISLRGFGH
jgi:hypothetical protein